MKENSCCKEKEIFPCLYYPVLSWQEILSMASVRKRELLCGAPEEIEKLKEMSICFSFHCKPCFYLSGGFLLFVNFQKEKKNEKKHSCP